MIEVQQTRSFREVPSIAITFPNGVKDSMVLERFYPTQESRMARTPSCNFIGHLENEKTACISLTGCASSDDLHFTINSKNSGSSNMYILHKDGHLELVESAFKVGICLFSKRKGRDFPKNIVVLVTSSNFGIKSLPSSKSQFSIFMLTF